MSIVNEAAKIMSMEAKRHNINLEVAVGAEELWVECDRDRILQVVINLLSNAIRYNKENGRVFLSLNKKDNKVLLLVEDTGIGIRPQDKDKIFDRFFQVISDAPRRPGGTGLGLAICKSIIDMHKGRIWVESEHGVGSKFYVELPLVPC